MVFTHLSDEDKYFAARPDLLGAGVGGPPNGVKHTQDPTSQVTSAVHKALAANPEATASLVSAGLRHQAASPANKNSQFASAAANPEIANSVGRVAAAALAFNHGQNHGPASPGLKAPPPAPSLARRVSSTVSAHHPPPPAPVRVPTPPQPPAPAPAAHIKPGPGFALPGHTSGKSIGIINAASLPSALKSMAKGPPKSAAPPLPSAFPKKPMNFAPPPMRQASGGAPPLPRRKVEPEPEPQPEEEEEEVEEGEWAEAMYSYTSTEAGDLQISEGQQVKVLNRDSDDWWSGEVDGRTGLFPASYVKML